MALILNIDTAVQTASVCLAENGRKTGLVVNPAQKDHAAWLQPAIADLLQEQGLSAKDLDAVAISAGPGSYTGLRVGMAAAKGLCYALQIPLITVSTLQMMAAAAVNEQAELLCPMIDARRMEVFTAIYNKDLGEVVAPSNCILTPFTFSELLENNNIVFFGSGCDKFREIINHPRAFFKNISASAEQLAPLSYESFYNKKLADVAYCEPFYGKEFFTLKKASDKQ